MIAPSAAAEQCRNLAQFKQERPVFLDNKGGLRIGISTKKKVVAFQEPILVSIWIDNQTGKSILAGGRCVPYLKNAAVFDHSGRRMTSIHDQWAAAEKAKGSGWFLMDVCASTGPFFEVPAHTCKPPADQEENFVLDYKLGPGVYYVFSEPPPNPARFRKGLRITVKPVDSSHL